MKYFQLAPNSSNEFGKIYKNFGINFLDGETGADIEIKTLFEKKKFKSTPVIQVLTDKRNPNKGISPNFTSVGTGCIVVIKKLIEGSDFHFSGLTLIPVIDKSAEEIYYALCFDREIDCVNLEKSDYERWPDGVPPTPWSHPVGSFFIKPVLRLEKIPKGLDVFTLENWGAPFNFVVNEKVRDRLMTLDASGEYLFFTELVSE